MEVATCSVKDESSAAAVVTIVFLSIFVVLIVLDGALTYVALRACILTSAAPPDATGVSVSERSAMRRQSATGTALTSGQCGVRELQLLPRTVPSQNRL